MRRATPSYALAVVVSLGLHAAVAALLVFKWPEPERLIEPAPKFVKAEVIQVESAAEKARKLKAEQQRKAREQAAKRKQAAEQAAKKRAAEKQRQEAALKKQAEAQRLAKAKAAAEAKQLQQQEQQRQAEVERRAQEQALLEQAFLEEQQRAEQEQYEAAKQAESRAAVIAAEFIDQIRDQVASFWTYPSNVRPEQEVEVRITLVPTGEVVSVQIVKGSGNSLLDNSVSQAIRKASPLPVPKEIQVFESNFRNFSMKFRPENATW